MLVVDLGIGYPSQKCTVCCVQLTYFSIALRDFVRIARAIVPSFAGGFHVRQALAYGFLFVAVFLFVPGMAMAQTDATVTGQITDDLLRGCVGLDDVAG